MQWGGVWVPATQYPPWAVVRDGYWTMIANKTTLDRPAPQATGSPFWLSELGDIPSWSTDTVSTTALYIGQRFTTTDDLWVTGYRIWITSAQSNRTYQLWLIKKPTTAPAYEQLIAPFQASSTGWFPVAVGAVPLVAGSVFDLMLITNVVTGVPSTFNGNWDYSRSNAVPIAGEANHSTNGNVITFHHTDNDSGDRQTDLESITVGGTIAAGGVTWDITDIVEDVNTISYSVVPNIINADGIYNFVFAWRGAISLDYSYITDYYSGAHEDYATVKGYFSSDGYDPSDTLDENAYGVDIQVQNAEVSDDWDLVAYGGAAGGTGGGVTVSARDSWFPLEVSAGRVPGMSAAQKFGRATNVDTDVVTDIWDRANPTDDQPIWIAPTQARIHNIVSSDAGDASAGNGARTVKIYGLTSWSTKEVSETITMNGTTNVATTNSYVIIHRMKVLTKGITSINIGKITATAVTDATVTAQINAGQGQTQMAIYGWPSIQTAYATELYGGILRSNLGVNEAQADIQYLLNPNPDVELLNFQIKHPSMIGSRANSPFTHNFDPYAKFEGPAILKMQAIGGSSNLDISGGFGLVLEDI